MICKIPLKLPSLNEYVNACRTNKYAGGKMKKEVEKDLAIFLNRLPKFEKPVTIHFHWIEANQRRDYDNIAFAKKFILDTLVSCGKLKDDRRRYVTGFTDTFATGENWGVILDIKEVDDVTARNL